MKLPDKFRQFILNTLLCAPLLLPFIEPTHAESSAISVSPLLSVESVRPGEGFLIGFHFKIKEPWHIYWKYPGPSGLPTRVKINVPDGLKAGELQFPTPLQFMQPGNIVGYGYLEEALLWVQVESSKDILAGTTLPITGEVRWLGCSDRCVPGKSNFNLTVSFGAETKAAAKELFDPWLALLPKPAPSDLFKSISHKAGNLSAGSGKAAFTYLIEWPEPPAQVHWFPAPLKEMIVDDVITKTSGSGTELSFSVERMADAKSSPQTLDSVLAVKDAQGKVRGYELAIKLAQ